MVTPSTSLPFELDHITSRLCESVHRILQGFWCASRVCTSDALDAVAQQIGDVVLMYLSPAQLRRESTAQVVPDQTTLNPETKRNTSSFTGFLKTPSENALT